MTKLLTTLGVAAMVASMAGQALALNPQPLPPRKIPVTATHHTMVHFRRHSPWGHHYSSHHHGSHHTSHHSSHHHSGHH